MIWFGGFRGLGTLYWENLEGLHASADIYGEPDVGAARDLLRRRGVTHVAFFAWDPGLEQLLNARASTGDSASAGARGVLQQLEQQLRGRETPALPPWLVPLPYDAPRVSGYAHPIVHLFEVVDDLPPE